MSMLYIVDHTPYTLYIVKLASFKSQLLQQSNQLHQRLYFTRTNTGPNEIYFEINFKGIEHCKNYVRCKVDRLTEIQIDGPTV